MKLAGYLWWRHFHQNATENLRLSVGALTAGGFTITLTNSGTTNTTVTTVMVSPLATVLRAGHGGMPATLRNAAIFVIERNGSIIPLSSIFQEFKDASNKTAISQAIFGDTGYVLAPGASVTFTYNGTIVFGHFPFHPPRPATTTTNTETTSTETVVAGQQYLVTVIGTDSLASYVAVAQ